jgi:hypothetical protein
MASQQGHDAHGSSGHHDDAVEQDAVRTPAWLPFVGLGLLLMGALGTYLWVYPGTMSPSTTTEAADGGAGAGDAAAPGNAAPQGFGDRPPGTMGSGRAEQNP